MNTITFESLAGLDRTADAYVRSLDIADRVALAVGWHCGEWRLPKCNAPDDAALAAAAVRAIERRAMGGAL